MFDLDRFIADLRATLPDRSRQATRDVVARAIADPTLLETLGTPTRAAATVLHQAPDLTVLNIAWGPRQISFPHDHGIWAVIGIYTGREDHLFWRRTADDPRRIQAVGGHSAARGEIVTLGADIIHSVVNPLARITGAIHVYGGDFFGIERSEWDPETLAEQPFAVADAQARFDETNRLYGL